jgi:prolipoprotein diacylglyceryltransferase
VETVFPGFKVGPVEISYFGLLIVIGTLAGTFVSRLRIVQAGKDPRVLLGLVPSVLVGSIAGGRIGYVLFPPPAVAAVYTRDWLLAHWSDMLVGPYAIWNGGLDSAGAWLGGIAAALITLLLRRLPVRQYLNLLAPGILLALAFTACGNLINRQLLGPPTTLVWGMSATSNPPYSLFDEGTRFHPTPAYVMVWTVLSAFCAYLVRQRIRNPNLDFGMLLIVFYFPGLFAADFLRLDVVRFWGLTGVQFLSIGLTVVGAGLLATRAQFANSP